MGFSDFCVERGVKRKTPPGGPGGVRVLRLPGFGALNSSRPFGHGGGAGGTADNRAAESHAETRRGEAGDGRNFGDERALLHRAGPVEI